MDLMDLPLPLCYCEKCGQQSMLYKSRENLDNKKCLGCLETGHFKLIPEKYITWIGGGTVPVLSDESEKEFIENVIKASPNFDQSAWDRRVYWEEYDDNLSERIRQEQANQPKCPYCGSTNISKIGVVSRAVSVGLLGLASSKIGKTHKCNKCGSTW